MAEILFRPIDQWPGALSEVRKLSPFKAAWSSTRQILLRELDALDATNAVMMLALKERDIVNDGTRLRADVRQPEHPGVIVAFDSKHGPLKYATDVFAGWRGEPGWQQNARAIALGLEALRKVDRYGIASRGEQYTGWKALGAGTALGTDREYVNVEDAARMLMHLADGDPDAWEDLIDEDYRLLDVAYRDAAKRHHPDQGGDASLFAKASSARDYIANRIT